MVRYQPHAAAYLIALSPRRRRQFQNLPTSFVLPDPELDSLRAVAGALMRQSPEYHGILRSFGSEIAD